MLRGGYPRLYDVDIPAETFYSAYIETYVERDVRDYLGVKNLSSTERYWGSALNVPGA